MSKFKVGDKVWLDGDIETVESVVVSYDGSRYGYFLKDYNDYVFEDYELQGLTKHMKDY